MPGSVPVRSAVALAIIAVAAVVRAQPAEPPAMQTVVVTANPLGSDLLDMVTPIAVLGGEKAAAQHAAHAG